MRISSYTIPSFTIAMLSPPSANHLPCILQTLCDVIRDQLSAVKGEPRSPDVDILAREVLNLIEALALTGPEELIPQYVPQGSIGLFERILILLSLAHVIRGPGVMSTLVAPTQPVKTVSHFAHALALLAARKSIPRYLRAMLVNLHEYV